MEASRFTPTTFTFGQVAKAASCSPEYVTRQARGGVLPPDVAPPRAYGQGAQIPEEIALDLIKVMRARLPSPTLPPLMRERPEEVLEAAEALARLARLHMARERQERQVS